MLNACLCSRIRRVKCDEEKPHCRRCTSTGRKCDGYAPPKASTRAQPRGMQMAPVLSMSTAGRGFLPTSECVFMSRRSFHMFNELYAPMICGYGTAGFWTSVVPQASQVHESIKHLVIAASNATCRQLSGLDCHSVAFLTHYGRALKLLGDARQDVVTVAISCVLIAFCEELHDRRSEAQRHIQAGQRMLSAESQNGSALASWRGTTTLDEIASTLACLSSPKRIIRWGLPLTVSGY